ncbi:unnamed protein product [Pleuronectes platessa]|uniref:Uncharacterized protein n=1 Tax=Pleuronectes platessa TaxID=8262 RepID=A0A9N7ULE0_PLEPL|nr:unnamed protein product [Pleuronectes platessa]
MSRVPPAASSRVICGNADNQHPCPLLLGDPDCHFVLDVDRGSLALAHHRPLRGRVTPALSLSDVVPISFLFGRSGARARSAARCFLPQRRASARTESSGCSAVALALASSSSPPSSSSSCLSFLGRSGGTLGAQSLDPQH